MALNPADQLLLQCLTRLDPCAQRRAGQPATVAITVDVEDEQLKPVGVEPTCTRSSAGVGLRQREPTAASAACRTVDPGGVMPLALRVLPVRHIQRLVDFVVPEVAVIDDGLTSMNPGLGLVNLMLFVRDDADSAVVSN